MPGKYREACARFGRSRALLILALLVVGCVASDGGRTQTDRMLSDVADGTNWAAYGRTYDENHYSPLTEIDANNVGRLGLAWSLDLPPSISSHGAPLAIDGKLYFAVGLSVLRAVDAVTGKQLWSYDPQVGEVAGDKLKAAWGVRGIAYWEGKIIVGTLDGRLIAVDAGSGKPVWSVQTTSPGDGLFISGAPRVFDGKVIIGNGGADFSPARGYVTAYDAATGKQLWRFYTVPGNPAKGFENDAMRMAAKTWSGEWWKEGGGGTVWNSITYDPELKRIYIGTGNGAPWNQKIRDPKGGDNLFLCSIVALDADTGKYVWHYQVNPGETWDRNSAMDIELATLKIGGSHRRVILHAPKNGFFYVIDRDTGKLISAEPFAKQNWAERIDPVSGRPIENPAARFPNGRAEVWPGGMGAHNWEPMAYSPKRRLVFIPTIELPGVFDDRGITPQNWHRPKEMVADGSFNGFKFDGKAPPPGVKFGHLQAWDPVAQKRMWSVPMTAPINGGVMATAGDLVFQGTAEGKFVAYAAATGKPLWTFDAQNGIIGQPITYVANGHQYVTVITGFAGTAAMMGPLAAEFGWNYREQKRRVLTFMLDGKATLPPAGKRVALKDPAPTFRIDAARADAGEALFTPRCISCHGPGAISGGTAPDLRFSPVPVDAATFAQIVRGGALRANGMPQFALTDGQLEDLRHYLRREARKADKGARP